MKRLYLSRDTRSGIHYDWYIGRTMKKLKKEDVFIKKTKLIDTVTETLYKQTVDLRVIEIVDNTIYVEVA